MPKVSVIILTKNRAELLKKALFSVAVQTFKDFEVIIINDGSTDSTMLELENLKSQISNLQIFNHKKSKGITLSRQEALISASGEYVAILDDDDEWIDVEKLKKQVEYLDEHSETVLVGGGIEIECGIKNIEYRNRAELEVSIKRTMLLRNNFFTSAVMFRRMVAIKAGGFIKDNIDLAEDYDLWLRLGKLGKMYNFQVPFVKYRMPSYNKKKFNLFLQKQLKLVEIHKKDYPFFWLSWIILKFRLLF